jgi:hypothetical protein
MLPSVISTQVETALKSFLLNSFDMSSPLFRREDSTTAMTLSLHQENAHHG